MGLLSTARGTAPARQSTNSSFSSRLLPQLFDAKRLDALEQFNVLDFGRASAGSFEFFSQFNCRLSILDCGDSLLRWSRELDKRVADDHPPSQQQLRHELHGLLSAIDDRQYDIVLLWDTLNHLHPAAVPALASLLRRHVHRDFRGHAFVAHKPTEHPQLRVMSMRSTEEIQIFSSETARLYPHSRKAVNEALGTELRVRHAVLHGDGRLECIICAGDGEVTKPIISV